jgi:hypothetical protein
MFERMLNYDKDICMVPYPIKTIDFQKIKTKIKNGSELDPMVLGNQYTLSVENQRNVKVENGFIEVERGPAGCMLIKREVFDVLIKEYPELDTPKLRSQITEACDLSVHLEYEFIDKAFEMGDIEGLNKDQLKAFIKARANEKMIELGYANLYNDIDPNLLKQMEWFGHLTSGKTQQDFFAGRVTNYSKSVGDWSDL